MKKLLPLILIVMLVAVGSVTRAQCTINRSNVTNGVTASNTDTIVQGVAYSQTYQLHLPGTYSTTIIDSLHITGITGLPSGISVVYNPAVNGGCTIDGDSDGAICFSGTTTAAVGAYPLTWAGTIYTNVLNEPISILGLSDTFFVTAPPPPPGCDTLINFDQNGGQAYYYSWDTPYVGHISSNGDLIFGTSGPYVLQTGVAEEYTVPAVGYYVNTAVFYPAQAVVNPTDSGLPVTIYVYDNTGSALYGLGPPQDGAPGNALDSATITLKELAQVMHLVDSSGYLYSVTVNFPHQPALTGTEFFIVVNFPQTEGDTIGVFTNSLQADSGRGWLGTIEGWMAYDSLLTGAVSPGLFMASVACPTQKLPPIASFDQSGTYVCANTVIHFTDASSQSPDNWYWDFGDGVTDTAQSPNHLYTTPGTYVVIEYAGNQYGATEAVSSVTVVAPPDLTTTVINDSTSTSQNASVSVAINGGSTPYSYLWSNGATTDTIFNLNPGTYSVTVTDANSCSVTSSGIVIVLTGVINLSKEVTVKVYPNPASDVLNLEWSQKSNADVAIIDLKGNVISSYTTVGDLKSVCNLHGLASGSYILRLTDKTNNGQQSMMFSKF